MRASGVMSACSRRPSAWRPAFTAANSRRHSSGSTAAIARMPPTRRDRDPIEDGSRAGQHREAVGAASTNAANSGPSVPDSFIPMMFRCSASVARVSGVNATPVEAGKLYSRTGIGDSSATAAVVSYQERLGAEALEEGWRSYEHRVRAQRGGTLASRNGRACRLAAGPRDHDAIAWDHVTRGTQDEIGFVVVQQSRFAVRPERDDTAKPGAHPSLDVETDG